MCNKCQVNNKCNNCYVPYEVVPVYKKKYIVQSINVHDDCDIFIKKSELKHYEDLCNGCNIIICICKKVKRSRTKKHLVCTKPSVCNSCRKTHCVCHKNCYSCRKLICDCPKKKPCGNRNCNSCGKCMSC